MGIVSVARILTTFVVVCGLLTACATPSPVGSVSADTHDFGDYKTFAWVSEHPMKTGPILADPKAPLEPLIMREIQWRLEKAGYQITPDREAADFFVSFTVGSREKIGPADYPSMARDTGGRGGWGTAFAGRYDETYTQGVLAIDIFDAKLRKPVWHGVTGETVTEDDKMDPTNIIEKVVSKILDGFPPE